MSDGTVDVVGDFIGSVFRHVTTRTSHLTRCGGQSAVADHRVRATMHLLLPNRLTGRTIDRNAGTIAGCADSGWVLLFVGVRFIRAGQLFSRPLGRLGGGGDGYSFCVAAYFV